MGYYRSIPEELEDAAMIDGCNRFQTFYLVVLPLVRPALLAVAMFSITQAWNEFLYAKTFLRSSEVFTLPVGLGQLIVGDVQPWGELMAASLLTALPVVDHLHARPAVHDRWPDGSGRSRGRCSVPSDQQMRRAAGAGPADLLQRRRRARLRGGRAAAQNVGRLHQLRDGARPVRRQPAARVHARTGGRRPDRERPPHAGGDRHAADRRLGRAGVPRQRVDGPPGAGDRRARHLAVPRRVARGGQGVRRIDALSVSEGRPGRSGGGRRGSGGQATAAAIWGVESGRVSARADPWPLNPDGELLLG